MTNELFRFGGVNSIRGSSENSLQASFITSVITEYRHLIYYNLQLNTILDYCYYNDLKTIPENNNTNKLISLGLGIAADTQNEILKLAIVNGRTRIQEIKFYNTYINISYSVKFRNK